MSLKTALLKADALSNHARNLVASDKATSLAEHYLDFKKAQAAFAEAASKNINNQSENSKEQLKDATEVVLHTTTNLVKSLKDYAKFLDKHASSIHSNLYKKAQMIEDVEDLKKFASDLLKYEMVVKKLQDRLRTTKTNYTYKRGRVTENLRANIAARKFKQFGELNYLSLRNLGQLLNRTLPSRQANRIRPGQNVEGIGSLYGNTDGGYRRRRTVKRNRN